MMDLIGRSIRAKFVDVYVPNPLPVACSDNVITMTFMNGFSLATFLSDHSSLAIDGTSLLHFANKLVEVYAYQIFELGIFHSDPHPGNILISSTGALTLLDFGQVKVLSSRTRENLARLVVALDQNSPLSGQLLDNMGVKVQNATASMKTAIAYVLFDTRMDIAEAKMNPFDSDLPPEIRQIKLSRIPRETFMLIRVIALLRGILSALKLDVHARSIWSTYATKFLQGQDLKTIRSKTPRAERKKDTQQVKEMAQWLASNGLPASREHLTPLVLAGVWNIEDLSTLLRSDEKESINSALKYYKPAERFALRSIFGDMNHNFS
jgi:aarF domain-containing kinase|tara:strand:+ start:1695 stop:2660 length:966 start_codon:yes stop_codon:yes gene_type:complete